MMLSFAMVSLYNSRHLNFRATRWQHEADAVLSWATVPLRERLVLLPERESSVRSTGVPGLKFVLPGVPLSEQIWETLLKKE